MLLLVQTRVGLEKTREYGVGGLARHELQTQRGLGEIGTAESDDGSIVHVGRQDGDEEREEREKGGNVRRVDFLHLKKQVVVDVHNLPCALDQASHLRSS